jgi:glutamine amidotransferase
MISIINTGVANIRSLQAAFDRLGQSWELTEDPQQVADSTHVVLPGVGAFAAAAESLDRLGLREPILDRIQADRPLLCICLGMQLLGRSSEECPTSIGLGVIDHSIKRFPQDVKVPQLGWNSVRPTSTGPFPPGEAYFANSFRLSEAPDGWGYAETDYAGPFISSIWRGRVLACQFHPELSSSWGQQLLANWFENRTA